MSNLGVQKITFLIHSQNIFPGQESFENIVLFQKKVKKLLDFYVIYVSDLRIIFKKTIYRNNFKKITFLKKSSNLQKNSII